MSDRHGVTLMEVLVAIFVMGIGMLAMLVLFPLGVLRMSQSIVQERCGQACRIANAIGNFQQLRNDPFVLYDPTLPNIQVTVTNGGTGYAAPPLVTLTWPNGASQNVGNAPIVTAGPFTGTVVPGVVPSLTIANTGANYATLPSVSITGTGTGAAAVATLVDFFSDPQWSPLLKADPNGPSFPVFVDPMGVASLAPAWLTPSGNTIRRRAATYCVNTNLTPSNGLAMRWTCLLDDLPFFVDGTLQYDPGQQGISFTRDIRYNWAYMLRRPRTADKSVVDMTVVVYTSRPLFATPNEYRYSVAQGDGVQFDPAGNSITITPGPGNFPPPVRPGDWLLDASYIPNAAGTFATVNGYFYRVVGVNENSPGAFTFDVQQPLRNMTATMAASSTQQIIVLEGVGDVFEKGPGRVP